MANNIIKDLEDLIESSIDAVAFPYKKGNSIRIGNMVVRESKNGYLVYDTTNNCQVARTFCKASAIAIAKNKARGRDITEKAMEYDKIIEKNYNDALFYKNTIKKSKESIVRETRKVRLELAIDRTRWAKTHLDRYIFGS